MITHTQYRTVQIILVALCNPNLLKTANLARISSLSNILVGNFKTVKSRIASELTHDNMKQYFLARMELGFDHQAVAEDLKSKLLPLVQNLWLILRRFG